MEDEIQKTGEITTGEELTNEVRTTASRYDEATASKKESKGELSSALTRRRINNVNGGGIDGQSSALDAYSDK